MTANWITPDLCDAHPDEIRVVTGLHWQSYGGRKAFCGPCDTVKCFEDNSRVKEQLASRGDGKVLVVDGGGSLRCALVGGNLAALGVENGWAGIVVNGCVRDSDELSEHEIGIKAIATHPRKSEKGLHTGRRDRRVSFAGVTFEPGMWLYADADGIVVSDRAIHPRDE